MEAQGVVPDAAGHSTAGAMDSAAPAKTVEAPQRETHSPELARLLDELTAERYRPVPPRPGTRARWSPTPVTDGPDDVGLVPVDGDGV